VTLSPKTRSYIRAAVDYGGLAVFLIAYLIGRDLVQATWWLVVGSAAALVLGFAVERRVAPMPLIAGGAALLFGTLTLVFHDPRFIKVKPTIMNLLFGLVLLGGLAAIRLAPGAEGLRRAVYTSALTAGHISTPTPPAVLTGGRS